MTVGGAWGATGARVTAQPGTPAASASTRARRMARAGRGDRVVGATVLCGGFSLVGSIAQKVVNPHLGAVYVTSLGRLARRGALFSRPRHIKATMRSVIRPWGGLDFLSESVIRSGQPRRAAPICPARGPGRRRRVFRNGAPPSRLTLSFVPSRKLLPRQRGPGSHLGRSGSCSASERRCPRHIMRQLTAIVFTDMVGYTALMQE